MSYYDNALKMRPIIEKAALSLSDEDALTAPTLFPPWQADFTYQSGERIEYCGRLYRCIQEHTAQAGWTPDRIPALWAAVSMEDWPQWVQPTGTHDAYNIGAKVSHKGGRWVSELDGNTWEPGVYGWSSAQ